LSIIINTINEKEVSAIKIKIINNINYMYLLLCYYYPLHSDEMQLM